MTGSLYDVKKCKQFQRFRQIFKFQPLILHLHCHSISFTLPWKTYTSDWNLEKVSIKNFRNEKINSHFCLNLILLSTYISLNSLLLDNKKKHFSVKHPLHSKHFNTFIYLLYFIMKKKVHYIMKRVCFGCWKCHINHNVLDSRWNQWNVLHQRGCQSITTLLQSVHTIMYIHVHMHTKSSLIKSAIWRYLSSH